MEAALLGGFMVSACAFGALLEHPASPANRRIPNPLMRRALMGLAMGLTAVVLIYSPWGRQSGAHMNPATTLTFLWLGKIQPWDAVFYICAQVAGGILGVSLPSLVMKQAIRHPTVNYVVTVPGRAGVAAAWIGEIVISFGLMLVVLLSANNADSAPYTGILAGLLLAIYITFEAPLSGMSLNPARTIGSALPARQWRAFWVYLTAPICGMLLAAAAYNSLPAGRHVYCAKLDHCNDRRCIFRCEFAALQATREAAISQTTRQTP